MRLEIGDRFKTEWAFVYDLKIDGGKEHHDVGDVKLRHRIDPEAGRGRRETEK